MATNYYKMLLHLDDFQEDDPKFLKKLYPMSDKFIELGSVPYDIKYIKEILSTNPKGFEKGNLRENFKLLMKFFEYNCYSIWRVMIKFDRQRRGLNREFDEFEQKSGIQFRKDIISQNIMKIQNHTGVLFQDFYECPKDICKCDRGQKLRNAQNCFDDLLKNHKSDLCKMPFHYQYGPVLYLRELGNIRVLLESMKLVKQDQKGQISSNDIEDEQSLQDIQNDLEKQNQHLVQQEIKQRQMQHKHIIPLLSKREQQYLKQFQQFENFDFKDPHYKFPIITGYTRWNENSQSSYYPITEIFLKKGMAGPSGTTDNMLNMMSWFKSSKRTPSQIVRIGLLICLGHMALPPHHTLHEMLIASKPYGIDYYFRNDEFETIKKVIKQVLQEEFKKED